MDLFYFINYRVGKFAKQIYISNHSTSKCHSHIYQIIRFMLASCIVNGIYSLSSFFEYEFLNISRNKELLLLLKKKNDF